MTTVGSFIVSDVRVLVLVSRCRYLLRWHDGKKQRTVPLGTLPYYSPLAAAARRYLEP